METNNISADIENGIAYCAMHPHIPRFTDDLLTDLERWVATVIKYNKEVTHHVLYNEKPGIFNLGGDLEYFLWCIENEGYHELMRYAGRCIALVMHNLTGYRSNSIITFSVVDGTALGGGMECAISSDFVITTPRTEMGFPEYRFGMYPGMGAKELLSIENTEVSLELLSSIIPYNEINNRYKISHSHIYEMGDFSFEWIKDLPLKKKVDQKGGQKIWDSMLSGRDAWVKQAMSITEKDKRLIKKILSSQEKYYS
jgi:DSF synthase